MGAARAPEIGSLPVFARAFLLERVDGDWELFRQVLEIFREDSRQRFDELRCACTRGDLDQAWRKAHALKGLAGSVGACRLEASARALEAAARRADVAEVDALLAYAQSELDELLAALGDV
ncbi:MAG: Hpt domain-containing protein [Candidatus Schekmanbacteria bacterium]|nr:Hpt domain-containing protein [Candidatus Schekmanbacteria bacterium]